MLIIVINWIVGATWALTWTSQGAMAKNEFGVKCVLLCLLPPRAPDRLRLIACPIV